MLFHPPSWKAIAGQNDVQPSLHIPMVYERVAARPMLWEYRVLSIDLREEALSDAASLNELGDAGWLLVNVLEQQFSATKVHTCYYFVRPKEEGE